MTHGCTAAQSGFAGTGTRRRTPLTARTWMLAVATLTLVALTRPIAAGDKRSSALAVRVTVVRSCSVNTDIGSQTGGTVTCGTRFGPPVMSTSSVITLPTVAPPPVRVDSANALDESRPSEGARDTGSSDAPAGRIVETSATRVAGPDVAPQSGDAEPALPPGAIRVVTVNF